jgi:hypothetical protein
MHENETARSPRSKAITAIGTIVGTIAFVAELVVLSLIRKGHAASYTRQEVNMQWDWGMLGVVGFYRGSMGNL